VEALSKLNFRDLGGIPVQGGAVRRGVLYRSEGPASFDEVHRAELSDLGFRVVCDLRSAVENQRAPNDWAQGARLLNFDIIADLRAQREESWSVLRTKPGVEGARLAMITNYRTMPAAIRPHLRIMVDALVAQEIPMLVHCTAGKDRTGVTIALLLKVLGASDEDIRRDYLLSERFARGRSGGDSISRRFLESVGVPPDEATLLAILGVDAAYLDAAMDVVASEWGSIDDYFADAGVDDAKRAELAKVLVEAA